MLKNALIFIAGLATGAAGAYLYASKKFDKELVEHTESMTKEFDAHLEAIKERCEKELDVLREKISSPSVSVPAEKPPLEKVVKESKKKVKEKETKKEKAAKTVVSERKANKYKKVEVEDYPEEQNLDYDSEYEEDSEEALEDLRDDMSLPSNTAPYVISRAEFYSNQDYDKKQLFYYRDDDILVDELTDEVYDEDDRKEEVGDFMAGFDVEDSDVAYIRNEFDHTDYTIRAFEGTYTVRTFGGN